MKKILLTESEKKAIITEREKAIISNFAKTFNSIKRIDENEVNDTVVDKNTGEPLSIGDVVKIDGLHGTYKVVFSHSSGVMLAPYSLETKKTNLEHKIPLSSLQKSAFEKVDSFDSTGGGFIQELGENGDDYEAASRGIEYGINPYQEQPDMNDINIDEMKKRLEWLESMIMNYDRAMMYDKKDEAEQEYYKLRNEISDLEQGNQLPF
jgi:hypothetical protein